MWLLEMQAQIEGTEVARQCDGSDEGGAIGGEGGAGGGGSEGGAIGGAIGGEGGAMPQLMDTWSMAVSPV